MAIDEGITRRYSPKKYLRWIVVVLVGIILAFWIGFTPDGILGKTDAIGYAVCHRIDLRSFHIGERQFPLCARCTGQFLGALTGLVFQAVVSRRKAGVPPKRVIALLAVFAALYGFDGVNSYLHLPAFQMALPNLTLLYEPNNVVRLITGTGMGLVISAVLYPAFISALYQQYDRVAAIPGIKYLIALVACSIAVSGLTLLNIPWILFLLAIISTGSVLLMLMMIYTIMILMVLHKENHYQRLSQAIFPILASLFLVILQIALMDIGRYLLTGTWGEIPFG